DVEFARQTLAGLNPYSIRLVTRCGICSSNLVGLNPYSIRLVTEWPLKSKLDPKVYGPPESAITKELIEQEIGGFMTVEEYAVEVESVAYDLEWRFDHEALPQNLISRITEEDPNVPHGLKLTIQDYPFC
ncbi:hypothetical protein HAX54_045014, partial [Datura stramonium]|nr:hypothetical protein [Datura stramonium]